MALTLLRPWYATDAVQLHAVLQSTPDLKTQVGSADLGEIDTVQEFISSNLEWQQAAARNFAIDVDGRVVGNIGLTNIDHRHRTGWMSYWLASHVRGHGLAARGAASVADWAFNEISLFRIELGHRTNNHASCRVATKAGFIPEGIERSKLEYGDARFDVETHARLASDPVPYVDLLTITANPN